ncbi:DUF294 nucleotidyltransferase-like domain-containing protein [Pseudoalteromonas denitrificans]|uniref:DUF294 nucleotidyltransferase-like domain-containing protein n=1 Tax=Pseudoalteromonas denitrificans TaxID=43656 RepID=UPI000B850227|nr:DUF294 nucleotidyltransferase-like domain-containing protein [Pseudoalteromonas denitrificans]
MTIEQKELFQFLNAQAPFSELASTAISYFIKHLQIIYLSKENQSQWFDSNNPSLFLIRSGLYDLVNPQNEVITRLSQGDYFGYPSLLSGETIKNSLEVQKDGIVYLLEQADFDFLRREYKVFEQYFVRAHANRLLSSHYKKRQDNWSDRKISELMHLGAVALPPDASIRQAAKKMSASGVSSIMITKEDKLIGVITDRDLRNRVLALDVNPDLVVTHIMTSSPKYIFENNRVFSAFQLMLRHNIHHLPVLTEAFKPIGMLTSTDLLRQQKSDPVQLIGRIYKANSVANVKRYALEIPELLQGFSHKVEDISLIGKLLSGITDALTSRLIYLYQEEFGLAEVPFCWICFGSQAREEQTLHSDQDNGLLLSDDITAEQRSYFKSLGEFVCTNLASCGIKFCPGNIMASSDPCRLELEAWVAQFYLWIKKPSPSSLLNCKIFFDIRYVEGSAELFDNFMNKLVNIPKNQLFFAGMATDINRNSVPIGLFNQFKLEKTREKEPYKHKFIDLKKRGVVIINDIVRLYALNYSVRADNTLERLNALAKLPDINKTDIYNLKDCWRYLTQLRLRTQINQEGLPSNCINPENLTSMEKHQLKEAFYLIKQAQQAVVFKFARGSL